MWADLPGTCQPAHAVDQLSVVLRLLDEIPPLPIPAKSRPSSQGQWHQGEMETPTLLVLTLNLHRKTGNISAGFSVHPDAHVSARVKCFTIIVCVLNAGGVCKWSTRISLTKRFFFSGCWSPFCVCSYPALVIAAKPGCLAATPEGLRITYREMEELSDFWVKKLHNLPKISICVSGGRGSPAGEPREGKDRHCLTHWEKGPVAEDSSKRRKNTRVSRRFCPFWVPGLNGFFWLSCVEQKPARRFLSLLPALLRGCSCRKSFTTPLRWFLHSQSMSLTQNQGGEKN